MTRLSLPHVTLFCADCVDVERAVKSLERCKAVCDFGDVKFLTSLPTDYPHVEIPALNTLCDYSVFMLKRAHEFIGTSHVLVVQHDGWILNPDSWDPAWADLDYVGPLFIHEHVIASTSVGTGGFSFRSKRIMQAVTGMYPDWDGTAAGTDAMMSLTGCYEDGVFAQARRHVLERAGYRFASPKDAARFAQGGNNDPGYYVERPFGFHGLWKNINHETGIVSPPPFKC